MHLRTSVKCEFNHDRREIQDRPPTYVMLRGICNSNKAHTTKPFVTTSTCLRCTRIPLDVFVTTSTCLRCTRIPLDVFVTTSTCLRCTRIPLDVFVTTSTCLRCTRIPLDVFVTTSTCLRCTRIPLDICWSEQIVNYHSMICVIRDSSMGISNEQYSEDFRKHQTVSAFPTWGY